MDHDRDVFTLSSFWVFDVLLPREWIMTGMCSHFHHFESLTCCFLGCGSGQGCVHTFITLPCYFCGSRSCHGTIHAFINLMSCFRGNGKSHETDEAFTSSRRLQRGWFILPLSGFARENDSLFHVNNVCRVGFERLNRSNTPNQSKQAVSSNTISWSNQQCSSMNGYLQQRTTLVDEQAPAVRAADERTTMEQAMENNLSSSIIHAGQLPASFWHFASVLNWFPVSLSSSLRNTFSTRRNMAQHGATFMTY